MIKTYRKLPVVIHAIRLTAENGYRVVGFVGSSAREVANGMIKITTLEGVMIANIGDYIIRGVAGEFYPCKTEIFRATYEAIN
jgi:sulfite reductase beta subunit-like hemoprotein